MGRLVGLGKEMKGGWPDQVRGEGSNYSPQALQVSWIIWDSWNNLLDVIGDRGSIYYNWEGKEWVSTAKGVGRGDRSEQTYQGTLQLSKCK